MSFRVDITGIEGVQSALSTLASRALEKVDEGLANAVVKLKPIYARIIQQQIRRRTRARTGTLVNSVNVYGRRIGQRYWVLGADFPATAYTTKTGRTGQYAFVVNARRGFLEAANNSAQLKREIARVVNLEVRKSLETLTLEK